MKKLGSMADLLAADFFKLKFLKSIYIAPVIMLVLTLISFVMFWMQDSLYAMLPDEMKEGFVFITGRQMLFGATSYVNMGLFIAIICGIFIGGEFSNGTIRTTLARGADRVEVYFSKWIVIATLIAIYTLFAFLLSAVFSAFGDYGKTFDGREFGLIVRSFALQYLVNLSIGSVFVTVAFLARSAGSSIGISLGLYIVVSIIIAMLITIGLSGSNSAWLNEAAQYFPDTQLQQACSFGNYTAAELARVILVPIAYIGLSFLIGLLTLIKRDVK